LKKKKDEDAIRIDGRHKGIEKKVNVKTEERLSPRRAREREQEERERERLDAQEKE
jgi:hypothetical protein